VQFRNNGTQLFIGATANGRFNPGKVLDKYGMVRMRQQLICQGKQNAVRLPHVPWIKIHHISQVFEDRLGVVVNCLKLFISCFSQVRERHFNAMMFLIKGANGVVGRATSSGTYHREQKIFLSMMAPAHISCERLCQFPNFATIQDRPVLKFLYYVCDGYGRTLNQVMFSTEYQSGIIDIVHVQPPVHQY
jgi:hypothetical protein